MDFAPMIRRDQTVFVSEGEYEQKLGKSKQGRHTGEGASIVMPPGRPSQPIPVAEPIVRAKLTEDLYPCSVAAAVLLYVDSNGKLQEGDDITVTDTLAAVGNMLLAQPDADGNLRIPASTCLYVYYFDDEGSYEPVGEVGQCCPSSSMPPGPPAECGVPCPVCTSSTQVLCYGPQGSGCTMYWTSVGESDCVPYTGATGDVDLGDNSLTAYQLNAKSVGESAAGTFRNTASSTSVILCDDTNALASTGNVNLQGLLTGIGPPATKLTNFNLYVDSTTGLCYIN
jgi:hypothetical protein